MSNFFTVSSSMLPFLGEACKIRVHFHSDHAGFYEQLLIFKFETCQQLSDKFEIMRLLEVTHRTSFSEKLPTSTNSPCDLQTETSTTTEGYITS